MKKAISLALVICTLFVLVFNTAGLAWLSDNGMSSIINITGNMHKSYFQSGDGSQDSPFEIANPTQLYYFSWLQYLGYFNQKDENGYIAPFYFRVSNDLDMTGLYLPPIGTIDYPFLGNFDGEGHTIYNLTIQNKYDKELLEPPNNTESLEGVEIIGFFGVIGQLDGDTSYTYKETANQISNFVLENLTVETQTDKALIGLVAGYVNGLVNKVGVVGSTVNIKEGPTALSYTTNLSDYTLIGYCADNYKGKLYSIDLSLYDPNTEIYTVVPESGSGGGGTGWGGSVKMKDIYTWLDALNSSGNNGNGLTTSTTYTLEKTQIVGLDNNTVVIDVENATRQTYEKTKFGSFVFTDSSPYHVNFVSGGQKVTEYKYTETQKDVEQYYIQNNSGQYITFNGNTVGTTTSEGSATKWFKRQQNNKDVFYTVYNNNVYYLTSSGSSLGVIAAASADHENLPSFSGSNNTYLLVRAGQKIKVQSNSYYLSYSISNNRISVQNTNNEANAPVWLIEDVSGGGVTISTFIDETKYYLSHSTSSVSLVTSTSSSTTWQYRNNQFTFTSGSRTYYLRGRSSGWSVTSTSTNTGLTMSLIDVQEVTLSTTKITDENGQVIYVKNIDFTKEAYIDNSATTNTYDQNGNITKQQVGITYFPLSASVDVSKETFSIATNNTGYIIGAEWGVVENDEHDQYGNIRISSYGQGSILNKTQPYTISYKTQGKFKTIPEVFEGENLIEGGRTILANLGLQKYADCYYKYYQSVLNSCDGLHFMEAAVSMSNIATIPYAYLNGKDYYNYQVPTNCIDFNLYDQGYINFVAGSYFTNNGVNNSFFSLYEIERNDNDEIIAIKEIYKIYAKYENGAFVTTEPYVYTYQEYKEGSEKGIKENIIEVGDVPEGYEEIFNCMWMIYPDSSEYYGTDDPDDPKKWVAEAPSNYNDPTGYAYYYEIPVNEGEYAIGSGAGRIGAYLVYLDLAANAELVERTRVDEKSYTEETSLEFPKGVSVLEQVDRENGESYKMSDIDPEKSAFVSIGIGNSGTTISQNESIITDGGTGHTAVYIGSDIQLVDKNGKPMTIPISKTTLIEQSTYYDYNIVKKINMVTTIKKFTVTKNGTETIYYTKTVVATDEEGKPALDEEGKPLSMDETRFEEDNPPSPDVPNSGQTPSFSNGEILKIHYIVADADKFVLDHRYTETVNSENVVTSKDYVLTFTNTGGDAVPITITLTELGTTKKITFKVVTGDPENVKVLQNSQSEQEVEVPVQPAENSSS